MNKKWAKVALGVVAALTIWCISVNFLITEFHNAKSKKIHQYFLSSNGSYEYISATQYHLTVTEEMSRVFKEAGSSYVEKEKEFNKEIDAWWTDADAKGTPADIAIKYLDNIPENSIKNMSGEKGGFRKLDRDF